VTWGNGTCAQPEGYGALLRYIASEGFVVVAANSRWVGGAAEMLKGLDFAIAANDDPASPFYQRLDPTRIAAMGHSQGGMGAINAANDSRVKTVIIFNGGASASKPFLTLSGDMDIFTMASSSLATAVTAAPKAAFLFYHMIPAGGNFAGHLTLMLQPERVVGPAAAWLRYMLLDDPASRAWFVGPDCKLCGHAAEYEFGQNGVI
jgi:pimeloyl-ACP methyl ester carboxylesterase